MGDRTPGKFEFEFLKFLSENPNSTSRQIFDKFGQERGYVRGTVVKAIDRLYRKGQVTRELVGNGFTYTVAPSATSSDQELIGSFVRERLGGRIAPLLAFFADSDDVDADQIRELKALIERIEAENK